MKRKYSTLPGEPLGEYELSDARYAIQVYTVRKILDHDRYTDNEIFVNVAHQLGFTAPRLRELAKIIKVIQALK